jgi:hypothetical protein
MLIAEKDRVVEKMQEESRRILANLLSTTPEAVENHTVIRVSDWQLQFIRKL